MYFYYTINLDMGKRSSNFKLNKKKKVKHVQKQKYDYSKIKGRIIGQLSDGCPIIGSSSDLITPWTIAPFESIDNKLREYKSKEIDQFDSINNDNNIDLWGTKTPRQINPYMVAYTNWTPYGGKML